MKNIFTVIAFIIVYINSFAYDWKDIIIKKGETKSQGYLFTNKTKWGRMCAEFDLEFLKGTDYILTGLPGEPNESKYQSYWNKVMKIQADTYFGKRNYITISWRYFNPSGDDNYVLQLGYYDHRDGSRNREFAVIGNYPRETKIHCELVLTEHFFYMKAGDNAFLTHRIAETWEDNQKLEFKLHSYFGDKDYSFFGWVIEDNEDNPAPNEIEFRVYEIEVNRDQYWSNYEYNSAPTYMLGNSIYSSNDIDNYYADKFIISANMESNMENDPNDYFYKSEIYPTYLNDGKWGSFTVFQSGSQVSFTYKDEVEIKSGTIMEYGSNVVINNNLLKSDSYIFEPNIDSSYMKSGSIVFESEIITSNINKNIDISLFPNPTKKRVSVKLTNDNIDEILLVNMAGQVVYRKFNIHQNNYEIDLLNYESGIYLCYITSSTGKEFSGRIIKE